MNSLLRVAEWGAVAAPSAVSVADSPQTTLDTPVSDTPAVSASSPTVARGNRLPSLVTESTLVSSVDALILGSFASASAGTAQTHDLADTGERIHRNSDLLKISMKASRFEDKYERRELIGQGGHGKVFLCVSRSTEDSLKYAVKDVDVNRLQLIPGFDKKKLRREVDILMSIDHPNIVYCYECFGTLSYTCSSLYFVCLFTYQFIYFVYIFILLCTYGTYESIQTHMYMHVESASNHMLMILEYCEGRDLVDIITERVIADSCFADAEAKSIVRQINSAVMYLHSHKIMHRDLKCDNIRVLESRTLSPHFNDLKLLDFGYSKFTYALLYM